MQQHVAASSESGPAGLDLFVSYSRRDREYVTALTTAVADGGLRVWVDLNEIPPADPDWPSTVDASIMSAPAFLFVISPDSMRSTQCRRELDVALDHHKQLLLVAHRRLARRFGPDAVWRSNWIPGEPDGIAVTVARILIAYSTDLPWKRLHADLDVAATRWRRSGDGASYLLRGEQLEQAERELAAHAMSDPPPTPVQLEFVAKSRDEVRAAERARADDDRLAVASDLLPRDPTAAALTLLEIEDPESTAFAIERMNEVLRWPLMEFEKQVTSSATAIAFSPDGRRLATGSARSWSAFVWAADGAGQPVELNANAQIDFVAFIRKGHRVVTTGNSGGLKVWNPDRPGRSIDLGDRGDSASWDPVQDRIALIWDDGHAQVYQGRRYAERLDLLPDIPFSYELDEWGYPTKPEWIRRHVPIKAPPGFMYSGPPGWYYFRDRVSSFSVDGERLVVASLDGTVRSWRLDDPGNPVIFHHPAAVLSASYSPDGARILTGCYDGRARIWPADGTTEPVILEHRAPVFLARFSPDGRRILTSAGDNRVRIWSADDFGEPVTYAGAEAATLASFSPDGDRIVTATGERAAHLYRADGLGDPISLPHRAPVWKAAFSPDGSRLATASEDGHVRVWSLRPIEFRHDAPLRSAQFSLDGRRLVTISADNIVRVWQVDRFAQPLVQRYRDRAGDVAFSPDGELIATSAADRTAHVMRLDGTAAPLALETEAIIKELAFSPDGGRVAAAGEDGLVRIWPTDAPADPIVLGPPGSSKGTPDVRSVAFSSDGRRVLAASGPVVRVWPADGSDAPFVLMAPHYGGYIEHVAQASFTADERGVIQVVGNVIRIWRRLDAGDPLEVRHESGGSVAISPNRRWAAIASSYDGIARIWNLETMEQVSTIDHAGPVERVIFSPLSSLLAILTGRPEMRVWTIATGTSVELSHERAILAMEFSRDEKRVVTLSADGSARAWRTDRAVDPLAIWHRGPVTAVDFSPTGDRIATASDDGTAGLWWVSSDSLRAQIRAATRSCLKPEFLQLHLGFSPDAALAKFRACERAAGRQPGDGDGDDG